MPKPIPALRPAEPHNSPARHDLAEALLDLKAAQKRHASAREPVARLEAEIAAADAARANLALLEADYADRMAAWAQTGQGPAPEPKLDERRAAQDALTAAAMKGDAAAKALSRATQAIDDAAGGVAEAEARIKPLAAAVLREEGAKMTAEYWRLYTALERIRRELAALDRVLVTDFPTVHAATGRPLIVWISPDKLSAPAAMRAIESACAGLDGLDALTERWRAKAAELLG